MNEPQITSEVSKVPTDSVTPAAPAVTPEVVPLVHVLRQIRRDSRRAASQYLGETEVPFGGE
jgi:hypothetical protein